VAVVLISSDLTVISRVEGAAKICNAPVRTFSSAAQAILSCSTDSPRLLIIDLATAAFDLNQLIETLPQLNENVPHVIAFGPHVHQEKLAAARQAGCDEVISRGQFFSQLSAILSRYAAD
jgi:DNA-binding NarL/FixJ family response regulator